MLADLLEMYLTKTYHTINSTDAHLTSGGEDTLIEGLRFQLPSNTANYCIANRQAQYFADPATGLTRSARVAFAFASLTLDVWRARRVV